MGYSIIIPIYKEEKNIAKMIRKVKYELNNKVKYELVFIDDDSADNSEKIFNKNKNKNTKLYIRKKKPRDLSKSVVFGFEKSKYHNLIVMDGDLQHNPRDIIKLIKQVIITKITRAIGFAKNDILFSDNIKFVYYIRLSIIAIVYVKNHILIVIIINVCF